MAVRGVVQGVGFRPFVYRLARANRLHGWVRNDSEGVDIHIEGLPHDLATFGAALRAQAPAAARISACDSKPAHVCGFKDFRILASDATHRATTRISPDLPVCAECLAELADPADRRYGYPYINCTNCGPRYSIVLGLPYDRPATTMGEWPMCEHCAREYHDPADRRFHAQPVACPACGPAYELRFTEGTLRGTRAVQRTAELLRAGAILALKGIGGYHLACDARNPEAVAALRARKYRKERPFALMARDVAEARRLVELSPEAEARLSSLARPIVLAPANVDLPGIAPDNREFGVMLPYTPIHHLLFAAGAPDVLVMTSANRSSEPIAYEDADALATLTGIADAFLIGERRIARRIDDSIVRPTSFGTAVFRRARGMAPEAVAVLPVKRPILALGADLKNAIALAVDGQVFVSQHIGDLEHYPARLAFERTVRDLCAMYEVTLEDALVVHDAHPEYASSAFAATLPGEKIAVQHHRAHIASVLAESEDWSREVVGVAFDGTGYGDDGTIWGGEFFTGSVANGLTRVGHLRSAPLPGGDAAARFPVQAAAGFLYGLGGMPDFAASVFAFPERYRHACELIEKRVRVFETTSVGRLFDTVAALLGFTREISFEGQAAMWLEHLAWGTRAVEGYPFPYERGELDFRPLLYAVVADRRAGRDVREMARAFHEALANAIVAACDPFEGLPVVVSGGVFQNALLLELLLARFGRRLRFNRKVPANDGGIALGQAALAALLVTWPARP